MPDCTALVIEWISIFNADQALLDELLLEELAC
jgi:hypothetical protein